MVREWWVELWSWPDGPTSVEVDGKEKHLVADGDDEKTMAILLEETTADDKITFVRGYDPGGSFETTGAELRQNRAQYEEGGFWWFPGGNPTKSR